MLHYQLCACGNWPCIECSKVSKWLVFMFIQAKWFALSYTVFFFHSGGVLSVLGSE